MAKKLLIIGAGIAGLSAGCYLQMNGYDTEIFELHNKPGGVCTSWTRKGYTFDGCIHWLVGTRDGSSFNKAWRELGALPGPRIVDHEEFIRIEDKSGKALIIYNDPDRLERHLKELSSVDSAAIEDLCDSIRKLQGIRTPLGTPQNWRERVEFLKMTPGLLRLAMFYLRKRKVTMDLFSRRFKDPFLREAWGRLFDVPDFPMIWMLMNLAWISAGDAGYPQGGSLEFARSIERRYLDLGGKVSYESRVKEITVEGDRATGIRLGDGTLRQAEVVISAADGHSTIFDMLGGRFINDEIRGMYASWPLFTPLVQLSLGVARDMSDQPHSLRFPLEKPLVVGGRARDDLGYMLFNFDPTLAPAGKSAMVIFLQTEYDYWETLHADREKYKAEKARLADEVIGILDRHWPGFKDDVEVIDVATPVTYVRYTANWRGSYEGWLLDKQNSRYMLTGMKKTLPGLEDFYMIGQWLAPGGGLPPAALHGRQVTQMICKKDGRKFTSSQIG